MRVEASRLKMGRKMYCVWVNGDIVDWVCVEVEGYVCVMVMV